VGCTSSRATEDAPSRDEGPTRKGSAATVSPTRWPPRAIEPLHGPTGDWRRCLRSAAARQRSRGRRRRASPELGGSGSTSHCRAARAGARPPCAAGRDASRLHALACRRLRRAQPSRAGGRRSRAGAHGDHRPAGLERSSGRSLHEPAIEHLRAATILPIPVINVRKSEELETGPPYCASTTFPLHATTFLRRSRGAR
jgi:hypothetical protein